MHLFVKYTHTHIENFKLLKMFVKHIIKKPYMFRS